MRSKYKFLCVLIVFIVGFFSFEAYSWNLGVGFDSINVYDAAAYAPHIDLKLNNDLLLKCRIYSVSVIQTSYHSNTTGMEIGGMYAFLPANAYNLRPQIGALFGWSNYSSTNVDSQTNYSIKGLVGVEWLPIENFSVNFTLPVVSSSWTYSGLYYTSNTLSVFSDPMNVGFTYYF